MKKIVAAVILLAATTAFAQTESTPRPQRNQEIQFSPQEIDGTREGPAGEVIQTREPAKFKSLIQVRESFSDRLMQSAQEL